MARKNKKLKTIDQDLELEVLMHARALNLKDIAEYKKWCKANGFSSKLDKKYSQRYKEIEKYKEILAEEKLKKHSKEGKIRYQIELIFDNKLPLNEINSKVLQIVYEGFRISKEKKQLLKALLYLEERTKLFSSVDFVRGIINFTLYRTKWLRDLYVWEPSTYNAVRQFSSLARHLFANYYVPEFMDYVWLQGNKKQQKWFMHIGKGHNIRTAHSLPIRLTKKMAHHFIQAPTSYSVLGAFRWAQVKALGGNVAIANAINGTRLNTRFKDEEFWQRVIQFFIENPMLDLSHVNPIVDYIWNQKYENRVEFVERGVAREIGPAQPNFSMRGRTAETLLRQVEQWHQQLGRESRGGNLQWKKSGINDFRYVEGNSKNRNMKVWTIRELLSSKELVAEGRKQGHCVASYANSCHKGKSAIYTMDLQNKIGITKMLTIEVNMYNKQICQARGKYNRLPTDSEKDIFQRWALKENLNIVSYV